MALDSIGMEVLNATGAVLNDVLLKRVLNLITLFQAIGGLIIAYLVFNIISLWQARKKRKDIEKIRKALERIEKKLDKKR
ncbi:MAG TPA: hypothetical protein VI544_01260 [Candidatus Nanoarchaeia archaeon]|nr:hypothetical protein [Candidatus Nanoarchaeia archaeon]